MTLGIFPTAIVTDRMLKTGLRFSKYSVRKSNKMLTSVQRSGTISQSGVFGSDQTPEKGRCCFFSQLAKNWEGGVSRHGLSEVRFPSLLSFGPGITVLDRNGLLL